MLQFVKKHFTLILVLSLIAFVVSCASIASPQGGEPDFDPPKVLKITPVAGATNVRNNKIEIIFDENVVVKDANDKVIVTPPQQKSPVIRAVNRKVTVVLRDTLLPDMTYTIDFTDAIQDNNENNPLDNFSFSFSTGKVVDSLVISGRVLTADNLEPVKGIYVGLHSNLDDTAFTNTKFLRISRTTETGEFTIRGVAPGNYRLYALDDVSREYRYIDPSQTIAFYDSIIKPSSVLAMHLDTLYNDKEMKEIDTIVNHKYTRFLPDNIVLRSFTSGFKRKFLQKHERFPEKLAIYFGAPSPLPEMKPLSFEKKDWSITESNEKGDTVFFWIKDKNLLKKDTLRFAVSYLKTDSLNQDHLVTDTLSFASRERKTEKKKEKKKKDDNTEEEEKVEHLGIKTNISSSFDTYNNISLEFSEPVEDSIKDKIKLLKKMDTAFVDIDYTLLADTLNPRRYTIVHKWRYGEEYQFTADSASIFSIYGLCNDKLSQPFRIKKEEDYAKLAIHVVGVPDSIPAFIELLNNSDAPVRKVNVKNGLALIRDLIPGKYYARIIFDKNGNGKWDTGDYYTQTQPELVCYYNGFFELKAFFEKEEFWHVDANNLANQKPLDITKNKPKDKEERRKKIEERDAKLREKNKQQQNQNSSYNTNNLRSGRTQQPVGY